MGRKKKKLEIGSLGQVIFHSKGKGKKMTGFADEVGLQESVAGKNLKEEESGTTGGVRKKEVHKTLRFTDKAWRKLAAYVKAVSTECGGFCELMGNPAENGYVVTDVHMVKQEVSGATVDLDDADVSRYVDDCIDRGLEPWQCARIWWHKHPFTNGDGSGQDWTTFKRLYGGTDWGVMLIAWESASGRYGIDCKATLWCAGGPGAVIVWKTEVETLPDDEEVVAWQTEARGFCHQKVYQFNNGGAAGTAGGGSGRYLRQLYTKAEREDKVSIGWWYDSDKSQYIVREKPGTLSIYNRYPKEVIGPYGTYTPSHQTGALVTPAPSSSHCLNCQDSGKDEKGNPCPYCRDADGQPYQGGTVNFRPESGKEVIHTATTTSGGASGTGNAATESGGSEDDLLDETNMTDEEFEEWLVKRANRLLPWYDEVVQILADNTQMSVEWVLGFYDGDQLAVLEEYFHQLDGQKLLPGEDLEERNAFPRIILDGELEEFKGQRGFVRDGEEGQKDAGTGQG